MNKSELISYISEKKDCTKVEAERIIDVFTSSITSALSEGQEISLLGFGSFGIINVASRTGRNPKTGKSVIIAAHKQIKFKSGQKLKDACNNNKR